MRSLPGHAPVLLELDLSRPLLEVEADDPLGRLRSRNRPRLRSVLRALHEAGPDRRVRGLIARVGGSPLGWTTMQELRAGVRAFGASGKPTVAWSDSFGEGGNATADYVLASEFGEVWLQPTGEVGLLGVAGEVTFVRGALDKLGIEPQLGQRYEFKNAADRILRSSFTPSHREAVDRIVESVWTWAVRAVADGRSLPTDTVSALADRAPLTAVEALDAGLVDRLGYRDQAYADLRGRVGEQVELLFADQWSPRRPVTTRLRRHRGVVALVEAHGQIVTGPSRRAGASRTLGSDSVSAALRAARNDDRARAVLLRVDSPGGSAVASDVIWREVALTREMGKPVVVSMGAVAGSGGYYIACPADVIVAEPATLTGSIGVLGGKAVVSELLQRMGVTTDAVMHGSRSRMFSLRVGFSDEERDRLEALLDHVYEQFIAAVAEGRRMPVAAVEQVARGRVWTGADAAANGLVDVLGGFRDAARITRERAGLPDWAPVRPAVHVPPVARLRRPRSSQDPRAAFTRALDWGDLAGVAAAVGLPAGGALLMPGIRLR
jgi:protease IV